MPIMTCQREWKPWYKWGEEWYCYTYTMGDRQSRENARQEAMEQWKAIETNKMKIIKASSDFNTVLFVALAPDEADRNGDLITEAEITKTAHSFMRELVEKKVNIDHEDDTDIETAEYVESFVAPVDIPVWYEKIMKWSWVVWIRFDDDTYNKIKNGDFVWVSIEWTWQREEL